MRFRTAEILLCGTQGGLYRADPHAPDPLTTWLPVNLPPDVSAVYRMASIGQMIVIATDNGISWSNYYEEPVVNWQRAKLRKNGGVIVDLTGAWSGLALSGPAEFVAGILSNAPTDWVFTLAGYVAYTYPILTGKLAPI